MLELKAMRNPSAVLLCLLLGACASGPGGSSAKRSPTVVVLSDSEYSLEGIKYSTFGSLCRALDKTLRSSSADEIVFEDPEGNMTIRKVAALGPLLAAHDVTLRLGDKVVEPKDSQKRADPCS